MHAKIHLHTHTHTQTEIEIPRLLTPKGLQEKMSVFISNMSIPDSPPKKNDSQTTLQSQQQNSDNTPIALHLTNNRQTSITSSTKSPEPPNLTMQSVLYFSFFLFFLISFNF